MSAAFELSRSAETREFLETIRNDSAGILDLRFIRDGKTKRVECRTVNHATDTIASHDGWNCYLGMATRRLDAAEFDRIEAEREQDPKKRRKAGGHSNLRHLSALWVDIDDLWQEEGATEAAHVAIDDFPLKPSMLVWSGGGLHGYWLLEEAVDVSYTKTIDRVEAIGKGICDFIGGDPNVTDVARIMRIPGTTNYPNKKKRLQGREESECVVQAPDNGRRYQLDDFEAFEERGAALQREKIEAQSYDREPWGGEVPKIVQELLDEKGPAGNPRYPNLHMHWHGEVKDSEDKSASAVDWAFACGLLELIGNRFDLDDEAQCDELANVVDHSIRARRDHTDDPQKHPGYYARTVGRAMAQWIRDRDDEPIGQAKEDASQADQFERKVILRGLQTIPRRSIEWLWPRFIEKGGPTLIDGDGDAGKTTMICDLVAKLTRGGEPGAEWPDGTPIEHPGNVVWVEGDPDGFGSKIRPIIEKAGGDCSRVFSLEIEDRDPQVYGAKRMLSLPDDLDILVPALKGAKADLVVLSPVSSMLAERYNPNSERHVRAAMMPVCTALDEIGCSQIWIRHLTKNPLMTSARSKGLGSVGWVSIARTALFLGRDITAEEEGTRVLAYTKANNVPDDDRHGLAFRFQGEMGDVPRLQWLGKTEANPDALGADDSELGKARRWICDLYADKPIGTGIPTRELEKLAEAAGISAGTAKRAWQAETLKESVRGPDGTVKQWIRVIRDDG